MTSKERQMHGRIGAHASWANTVDRTARTAPARAALDAKFLAEADGDPVRAAHLRKAYFARLAQKSAQARRKNPQAESAVTYLVYDEGKGTVTPVESQVAALRFINDAGRTCNPETLPRTWVVLRKIGSRFSVMDSHTLEVGASSPV